MPSPRSEPAPPDPIAVGLAAPFGAVPGRSILGFLELPALVGNSLLR